VCPFFGLTDEYKIKLHELIFDLCHYGHFGYESVYSMPVQYRTFYMRKLINSKEKEKDQHEAASRKHEATPSKISRGPAIKK
jgi:hypothetical protein